MRSEWGGGGDDREWDGWTASLTRWTWAWVNPGSWWWTGRPGVLQKSMGLQRVRHDWATELDWLSGWNCFQAISATLFLANLVLLSSLLQWAAFNIGGGSIPHLSLVKISLQIIVTHSSRPIQMLSLQNLSKPRSLSSPLFPPSGNYMLISFLYCLRSFGSFYRIYTLWYLIMIFQSFIASYISIC